MIDMIISTEMRTDIPTFYSEWFANRIKAGYVLVRNPYRREWVTQYELNPKELKKLKATSSIL